MVSIYVDAGKNPRTGTWQIGMLVKGLEGGGVKEDAINFFISHRDMNPHEAEGYALLRAIKYIKRRKLNNVVIYTDNQGNASNNGLAVFARKHGSGLEWIPRADNMAADELSKKISAKTNNIFANKRPTRELFEFATPVMEAYKIIDAGKPSIEAIIVRLQYSSNRPGNIKALANYLMSVWNTMSLKNIDELVGDLIKKAIIAVGVKDGDLHYNF